MHPTPDPAVLSALAAVVRAARAKAGWSVETAAEHAGVGHMTWRRIEAGQKVHPKTYAAVDTAFGLTSGTTMGTVGRGEVNALAETLQVAALDEPVGDTDGFRALGDAVALRRHLLHLRQVDIEARGGPGAGTVRNIEQGSRTSYSRRTFVQLDHALGWGSGTAERIVNGEDVDVNADPDWDALASAVRERRAELRLPQDLVSRGGPSEFTVRKIERGETDAIRSRTKTQLEQVLQWNRGDVDRILAGQDLAHAEWIDPEALAARIPPLHETRFAPQPTADRDLPRAAAVRIAERLRGLADDIELMLGA